MNFMIEVIINTGCKSNVSYQAYINNYILWGWDIETGMVVFLNKDNDDLGSF